MSAAPPRIAVIVNCYNYETYVERAIRSVQAQGRGDCELIVVDDGSTDGSWEVIGRTGAKAYRIENGGQRRACTYGLDMTSAPFVLFLDADDELVPGALDAILPHLQPTVAKLQFCLSRVDGEGRRLGSAVPEPDTVRALGDLKQRVLKTGVYASPPTSGNVFRRDVCELLREAQYDDAVDGIIILAAPFFGEIVCLPDELGLYRIHDRNMSGVGKTVDVRKLQQNLALFRDRIEHLRSVAGRDPQARALDVEKMFFYREKTFILDVLGDKTRAYRHLPELLTITFREYFTLSRKIALSLLYVVASVLPTQYSQRLIDLRYRPERRSFGAIARALNLSR